MLYLRVAAAAAVVLSLGGCSFFGFGAAPKAPKLDDRSTVSPAAPASPAGGPQLAALPGYLSDENLLPAPAETSPGFLGVSPSRPKAAPARLLGRKLDLTNFLPQRRILDLEPIPAALTDQSITLADLVADQAWRKRTSQQLERLFQ